MSKPPSIFKHAIGTLLPTVLLINVLSVVPPTPANAAQIFQLNATNLSIDDPSPLFTTSNVSGTLVIDDAVAPGAGFGLSQILGFSFNFAGILITLSDTSPPDGTTTAFGTRSTDGASLSFLDLRFDLTSTLVPCAFICAGQIQIGTFDRSNFVAINDFDALTTSLLIFDAALVAVPEPGTLALLTAMLVLMTGAVRRSIPHGGNRTPPAIQPS